MLEFNNNNFNETKKHKLVQLDTFEKCIKFIKEQYDSNQNHIKLGNEFFIDFLNKQKEISLNKRKGNHDKLDGYEVLESLWLLYRIINNDFFNFDLILKDKLNLKYINNDEIELIKKHVNRLYNLTHQNINNDPYYENLQTYSMMIKKSINKNKKKFKDEEEFLEFGKEILYNCLEERYEKDYTDNYLEENIDMDFFDIEADYLLNRLLDYKIIK